MYWSVTDGGYQELPAERSSGNCEYDLHARAAGDRKALLQGQPERQDDLLAPGWRQPPPAGACGRRTGRRRLGGGVLPLLAVCGLMLQRVDGGEIADIDGEPVLPFMLNTTNPFHPAKSLSFAHVLFLGFSLTYADTAGLKGYIGQDVVQLGRYYAKTKFGCITHCSSSDFNGIDGILGLGMPDAALASIPEPLFFALSDETGDPANQYILNRRIFTLVGTDSAAELHLGGFDPHATAHDMKYIRTTSPAEYSVPVSSISLGGHEFLNFASAAQAAGRTSVPGILDSGTSCLVVPDSTLSGLFIQSPYTRMMEHLKRGEPLYITIGGHQFDIAFHHWWLYPNEQPCIQPGPDGFEGVLLGDVIFRALVVMFDLTHPRHPVIGLAPRNPHYRLVIEGCSHVNDFKGCVEVQPPAPGAGGLGPMTTMKMSVRKEHARGKGSRYLRSIASMRERALHAAEGQQGFGFPALSPSGGDKLLTKVPVDFYEQTQYFVNVSVGTPRQTRTVILDTGSSVFSIFCDPPPQKHDGGSHIYLPHFIPAGGMLQTHGWVWGRFSWRNGFGLGGGGVGGSGGGEGVMWAVGALLLSLSALLVSVRYVRGRRCSWPSSPGAVALEAGRSSGARVYRVGGGLGAC